MHNLYATQIKIFKVYYANIFHMLYTFLSIFYHCYLNYDN